MKKKEQIKEYRGLGKEELKGKISELSREIMNLRFRKVAGQLENPARVGTLRRSIAQAKTVLAEKA